MNNQSNISHLPAYQRNHGTLTASSVRPRPEFRPDDSDAPRKKFVAKGHDSQLQEAQHNKYPVEIVTVNESVIKGTISRRDRFTITLNISTGTDAGKDLIVYKHAIESVLINKGGASVVEG